MTTLNLKWATAVIAKIQNAFVSACAKTRTATFNFEGNILVAECDENMEVKNTGIFFDEMEASEYYDSGVVMDTIRITLNEVIASTVATMIERKIKQDLIDALNAASVEFSEDLDGFIVEFGGRTVQVQFEQNSNVLSGDCGLFFPRIDKINGYGYDLNEEEEAIFYEWMIKNKVIAEKGKQLDLEALEDEDLQDEY